MQIKLATWNAAPKLIRREVEGQRQMKIGGTWTNVFLVK